ncbi:MAG: 2-amino-4-hydroxy-6-hydroxymethyldihydropteridine diphosphokinase [Clostridiaceae bacterium]|nr:2-amino-4-hydroxy-6-hydroxymethyldihydropteridine diphosphokinase [Clostridiaceae bacterium]
MANRVYLSLGSNMGDREKNLRIAVKLISRIDRTYLCYVSGIYETEPVGYREQGYFLNMAVSLDTDLSPQTFLKELQHIESILKRERKIHWGPRTIDIDILLYGGLEINSPELVIPHPRMFERAFVLVPLKEVLKGEPVCDRDIDELIRVCSDREGVRLYKDNTGFIESCNRVEE